MMNDFQQASSLSGERRRKRIITDARREQNRAASRAYRQRQKQTSRILQQNTRGCSRRYHELKPRHLSDIVENTSTPFGRAGVPPMSAQLWSNINPSLDSIASQLVSLETIRDSSETTQHIFPQVKDINQDRYFPSSEATAAFDHSVDDSQVWKYPAFESAVPLLPITNLDEHGSAKSKITPPSMNSLIVPSENQIFLSASHFFNPGATLAYPMLRDITHEREAVELSMSLSLLPLNSEQTSTFHSPNSRPRSKPRILDESHGQGLSTNEFENHGLRLEAFSTTESDTIFEGQAQIDSTYLPTPSLLPNSDRPCPQRSKLSPFIAYMHIAIRLGITLQDLTNGEHSSPFYRATTTEDDPKALLAAAEIPSLPAHLQPTLPQILYPHNSNLDLLPFPVLRARAITLAAAAPQLVNPKELKMDILRDGLICWHSRNDNSNGIGQPWDIHSWEAASWFKKKWRMLFNEDEDNYHLCRGPFCG